jgi:hypothetical protein
MTNLKRHKITRILAIAPASRGFGFAVLEGDRLLVDWGVKSITGNKNADTVKKVAVMLADYQPDLLVLEHASAKGSRHSPRVRNLIKKIVEMAASRKTKVTLLSREQVMKAFFIDGKGTKYTIAKILAGRFPEELGLRLPRKRRAWEGEDSRMNLFEAVALAITKELATEM